MDLSSLTEQPIPSVDPGDLRCVWQLMHETHAEFLGKAEPELTGHQTAIGIDVRLMARACNPEANVLAVWARSAMLGILVHRGLLTLWQRGTQTGRCDLRRCRNFSNT